MSVTTRPRHRRRWVVLGVVALVVAVVAGFLLLRPRAEQPTTRTEEATVTRTDEHITVSLTGTLASAHQAELGFGAPGRVTAIGVKVGEQVTEGATLAQVDDTSLRDAVALADAQLAAARAQVTQVRGTQGATQAQVAAARAQVASAEARLASARTQLASARITAPFAGTVAAVNIEVGDQVSGVAPTSSGLGGATGGGSPLGGVQPGLTTGTQAAIVLVTPDAWVVKGQVGPADVGSIRQGQPATVTVQGTTLSVPATVSTVGIVATTTSGATAFPVQLALQGSPAGLYYGAATNVVVDAGTLTGILTVPTAALTTDGTTTSVQKVVNGSTATTEVTTAKVFGDRTQVVAGLAEGDVVHYSVRVAPKPQQGPRFGPPPGAREASGAQPPHPTPPGTGP